jgi:hypothetical protein
MTVVAQALRAKKNMVSRTPGLVLSVLRVLELEPLDFLFQEFDGPLLSVNLLVLFNQLFCLPVLIEEGEGQPKQAGAEEQCREHGSGNGRSGNLEFLVHGGLEPLEVAGVRLELGNRPVGPPLDNAGDEGVWVLGWHIEIE